MPGHMGHMRHTVIAVQVVKIDAERNLIYVKGAVPGQKNGLVLVTLSTRSSKKN